MIIYQLLATSLLFTLPILASFIHSAIPLRSKKLLVTDLTWPFYAWALVLVSKRFFSNSFLPQYLVLLSILALLLIFWHLQTTKTFSYLKWFKFFWRWSFFLTLFAYLLTLVAIFLIN